MWRPIKRSGNAWNAKYGWVLLSRQAQIKQMLPTTEQKLWKCGECVWGLLLLQEMMMHLCWFTAECTLKPLSQSQSQGRHPGWSQTDQDGFCVSPQNQDDIRPTPKSESTSRVKAGGHSFLAMRKQLCLKDWEWCCGVGIDGLGQQMGWGKAKKNHTVLLVPGSLPSTALLFRLCDAKCDQHGRLRCRVLGHELR